MAKRDALLRRILSGTSDANIPFGELRNLLLRLGFEERQRGSHHIFRKEGVSELLNLQSDGRQAKPYQVRQVRSVIVNYGLAPDDEEDENE